MRGLPSHHLLLSVTEMDPKTISPHLPNTRPRMASPRVSPAQMLRRAGRTASFEELHDVDHFEIIWKLTQKDYALTQVGCVPSPWVGGAHRGATSLVSGIQGWGDLTCRVWSWTRRWDLHRLWLGRGRYEKGFACLGLSMEAGPAPDRRGWVPLASVTLGKICATDLADRVIPF